LQCPDSTYQNATMAKDNYAPRETLKIHSRQFYDLAQHVLDRGHALRFRANGSSMRPSILDDDIVTVVPAASRRLRLGSIVLHRSGTERVALHRILKTPKRTPDTTYHTRGDASGGGCEHVEREAILAVATHLTRGGRLIRIDQPKDRYMGMIRALRRSLRYRYRTLQASETGRYLHKHRLGKAPIDCQHP
jgi:hypothetical protein